ncbi:hypothetical protein ARMA_0561 [Ardenticatena maritima]|uniref:Histidine kinase domain-containing protein n=1 Tax=Ardenticatena maritima TaxID=872965 RepID=A0A0M9UBS0_9CHLR|nr:ATP-binding protein [Ardenticatena maritima]KPL87662.1 hypothetical protein SE16_08580 [Ardenticatena maritima]GAP62138.1 hypothetical protein ARMA_0561 [Ardenticatena maritima]
MREALALFFTTNQVLMHFITGQVFFVLGLLLAIQSRRHSRLALARVLGWLAGFGVLLSLHEWGFVFLPVQSAYLPQPFLDLLKVVHVGVLGVAFGLLFQFGVESLRPLARPWLWLRFLPAFVVIVWGVVVFLPGLAAAATFDAWFATSETSARLFIGVPGALLAAYGLRRQAMLIPPSLDVRRISAMLRIAGLAFVALAVFGGVVAPRTPFFNEEQLWAWTAIPIEAYRALVGLVLLVSMYRVVEVFNIELDRRLTSMEEEQLLLAERERLGRELHDRTLQSIYAAGLLLRSVLQRVHDDASLAALVEQSLTLLNDAVTDIRNHIGLLKPQPTGGNLVAALREAVRQSPVHSLADVETIFDVAPDAVLESGALGHLLMIVNEALSNVARHAEARHVCVQVRQQDGTVLVEIADDGQGFPADVVPGYGLRTMQERARLLGGHLEIETAPQRGTTVRLTVPLCHEQTKSWQHEVAS